MDIATLSISTLIQTQGYANLYWIYAIADRDGVDYNLAYIGKDFDAPKPGQFDPGYMTALFDYGYGLAREGYTWEKAPPGFAANTSSVSE